ncbi:MULTISPECIES: hypothetical protein [unclassified Actinomyces]|uniref:hypothetical protein n=1 Tax=unclassified Actinomyces TaxID=2609248 RepID=UPI000D58F7C6|nr:MULTISPECIES: hypothetical protein [unclassified Actinomyces]MBM6979494.1 hypothetical protein [Actinomyces succiniciruminis]RAX20165.1 hypothetical protein DRB06_09300 [Actinomyces sp. Z5]RAX24313.1 hypothetical protein DRB07_00970 [Actinomyces sp. Z3]
MSGTFSVDYDTATSNSAKMATASDEYASPAATSVDSVTVNQSTTTWSTHTQAHSCMRAYTDVLDQLQACIASTQKDLDTLKTNYDAAVTAFTEQDEQSKEDALQTLKKWSENRSEIPDTSRPTGLPGGPAQTRATAE